MARRRMFSLELISSDRFLSMSATAQSFYFHMGMHADDEGFVSAPNSLALLCKGSQKDLDELEQKGYIIRFDSGVLVIVDWLLNNTIRKERSMETMHRAEKAMLTVVDGRYVKVETDLSPEMSPKTEVFFSADSAPQNITEQKITEHITPEQNSPMLDIPELDDENGWAFGECVDRMRKDTERRGDISFMDNDISGGRPSLAQIKQFCQEEGLKYIKPSEFWVYYNGKGWKDKENNPVQNWKALARSWDDRNQRLSQPVPDKCAAWA